MKYRRYLFIPLLIVAVLSLFIIPQPPTSVLATETVMEFTFDHQPLARVTDPALMVQDNHTKSLMEAQGIDTNYVELVQDYGKTLTTAEKDAKDSNPLTKSLPNPTPYARYYKDKVSGKYIMEVQQLPMVNVNGQKCDTSWNTKDGKNFTAGINQFSASVATTKVTVIVLNDQPDGKTKKDTVLVYQPQLYLGVKEVKATKTTILPIDPLNENYTNNTLQWDYGICVRNLRLIEGSLQGSWTFYSNPGNSVRIVYNQTPANALKLGQYATDGDTETVPKSVFDSAQYPFTVGDSQTFYPDAHTESTSVDGYCTQVGTLSWANLIASAGSGVADSNAYGYILYISSATTSDVWSSLYRGLFLFDTSGLDDAATITGAVTSFYTRGKTDTGGWTPDVNIYSSNPASNTGLVAGDFDSLGSTAFATTITYANLADSGYTDFTLNASGIAAIPVDGVAKFGVRNANYDVAASSPVWASAKTAGYQVYMSEQGAGYKPKLVVTYTIPSAPTITISAASLITSTTARLNGNVTATGGENPTVTMYWGDNDGGQITGDWDNNSAPTSPAQPQGVAAFYYDATSLTSSKTYYFSAKATNSYGTSWAAASLSFKTLSRIAKINGISLNDFSIIW